MQRDTLRALSIMILVVAVLMGKSFLITVPAVRHLPGQFDADRAKARLAFILGNQQPHPADSPGDDAVRARLVASLIQMGLHPITRDQTACNDVGKVRLIACARVRNVIAALGPRRGKALVLSAHYDSVPAGPGASDDGMGVATLLEVGSMLSKERLKRPVLLLFNEGEELGLVGARGFLADPLSRNVDSLLNFEARGVTGPVTMFETNYPNGSAIAAYAASVRHPFASSLSTDVARLIPNNTDVTAFKERPWVMLNSAVVGNETRYHSAGDDIAGLDARSLQDMGDEGLALARSLSSGVPQTAATRVFVDIAQTVFVDLPLPVAILWLALLLAVFALVAARSGALIAGTAQVIGALVAGSFLGWLAVAVMGLVRSGTYWRAHSELTFLAIYATVLVAEAALLAISWVRLEPKQLRFAYWFSFVLLGALLGLAAQGAIIYFLFAPTVVLAGVLLGRRYPPALRAGTLLGIVILYLTWAELLTAIEAIFSPGPVWVVAPVAAIMTAPVLIEVMDFFPRADCGILIRSAAALSVVAWFLAGITPAYSQDHQQMFTIEHVTDFDSGRSYWSVLNDGAPLPPAFSKVGFWNRRTFDFSQRERWIAAAPRIAALHAAAVDVIKNVTSRSGRSVRLRLRTNGAERILLVGPPGAHITFAGVPGSIRPMLGPYGSVRFTLSCTGRSCDGSELVVGLGERSPVRMTIVGYRNGLPPDAAPLVRGRPRFSRPQYVPDELVTIMHATI